MRTIWVQSGDPRRDQPRGSINSHDLREGDQLSGKNLAKEGLKEEKQPYNETGMYLSMWN
jgi:hypothetical protein